MKKNEVLLSVIMVVFAAAVLYGLKIFTPPFQDGTTVLTASADSLSIRLMLLALFDAHCVALLYFFGGHDFKIVEDFRLTIYGKVALAIIIGTWFIGTGMVLHK